MSSISSLVTLLMWAASPAAAAIDASGFFDAMPTCKEDNWGMPYDKPRDLPKTYYDEKMRIPCADQWKSTRRPASEALEMATAILSANTQKYDDFDSVDLIPENRDMYSRGSPWGGKKFDFTSQAPKSVMASQCQVSADTDTSSWEITRIGPFRTTGGYDWLQIGWDNVFGLREILQHHPGGVYILEHYMSPVTGDGSRLQNPPIHIHHMHVGPAPYVRQRFSPMSCAFFNVSCFNPIRTLEHHGDYNCMDEEGGMDCRIESFPASYGKHVDVPLGLEGELNDVRPAGSPVLEWYFEIGIKWVPKDAAHSLQMSGGKAETGRKKYKAMSLHNIAGPGYYDSNIQKTLLMTFPIPTQYESIFWYTGRLREGGKLLRNKLHAHNLIFDQVLFISATPEQLGMTVEKGFTVDLPYQTVQPSDVGMTTMKELKQYILDNLKRSQGSFDNSGNIDGEPAERCGYPEAACHVGRPEVICQAHANYVVIDGFAYDRREPTCCTEWNWESGQVFTVIGFNKHQGFPQGPHAPKLEDVPEYLNGHVGWWFSYDTMETPEHSYWGYSLYNHDPAGGLESPTLFSSYQKVAMYFNKYSSPHFNDMTKVKNSIPAVVVVTIVEHRYVSIVIFMVLLYVVFMHRRCCKEDMSHKKNDCTPEALCR